MKVWELRRALEGVDDDALVVDQDGEDVSAEAGGRMVRDDSGRSFPAFVLDVWKGEEARWGRA